MELLGNSNRCNVHGDENKIIKGYYRPENYNTEKTILLELKDETFAPNIITYNDENMFIEMERINGISLEDFTEDLPTTFIEDMKFIGRRLIEKGIVSRPDQSKMEHIFICDESCSAETHGIRIIDFDVDMIFPKDNPQFDKVVKQNLDYFENNYENELLDMLKINGKL